MIEPMFIITNNPMSKENFEKKFVVEFVDGTVIDVFKKVRDCVHKGHRVLTHPLISSIKPNEIPYRTVIISKNTNTNIDIESLSIIEDSIASTEKFMKDFIIPDWNKRILEDFSLIDYDIIYNVLK